MHFFLQGLGMGLVYILPIGMQNLFVINTALNYSRLRVLLIALTVCAFDIALSLACFFGMGVLLAMYSWLEMMILLLGGILIISIGIKLFKTKVTAAAYPSQRQSFSRLIAAAFVVTWCNPQALLDGTMILGAFRTIIPQENTLHFIAGIMLASFIWFIGLSLFISFFRRNFKSNILRGINLICGTVIIIYGLQLLFNFGQKILSVIS